MSSGTGAFAPVHAFTPDDHGAIVTVTSFNCIFTLVTVILVRIWISVRRKLPPLDDDLWLVIAVIFAIAQSASVIKQVDVGLGKHWNKLSQTDRTSFLKLDYAIQFLAVSAMAATKTSVIQFYQRIAPIGQTRTLYLLFAMVAVWTVFSVFAQAFSCGLPNLWNHLPNDCSAQFSLRYAITSLNILTDAILGLGFLPVIWKLQTSFNRRVTVMALFASRLVVCFAEAGQIVAVARMARTEDVSWNMVATAIVDQVTTYLSIIMASLPRLHSFLHGLQTGRIGTVITDREIDLSRHKASAVTDSKTGKESKGSKTSKESKGSKGSKARDGAAFDVTLQPRLSSNANSESSLFRPQMYQASQDTESSTQGGEVRKTPLFRPPGEPLNTYDTHCFSDARGDVVMDRHEGDHVDEDRSVASLKSNVMYQKTEFSIEYPNHNQSKRWSNEIIQHVC